METNKNTPETTRTPMKMPTALTAAQEVCAFLKQGIGYLDCFFP